MDIPGRSELVLQRHNKAYPYLAEQKCRLHSDMMCLHAGMQSAALGFALARKHFADPLVAVPSAVSVVFMALGGSGLAVFWRGKPTTD